MEDCYAVGHVRRA